MTRKLCQPRRCRKTPGLLTLEAMKMQTTVYAPADGIVDEVLVQVGDTVQSKVALMAPVWTRPAPHHLHLAPR